MPGPAWYRGGWRPCSLRAVLPADWWARGRRGTCRSGAARSILCSRWSLLRWRSICWRVTYLYLERRTDRAAASPNETDMTKSIEMTGPNPAPTRRVALGLLGASVLGAGLASGSASAHDDEKVLTEALVLRDPEIPVIGNANGDITIVEYYDYNCPYCRKIAPEIRQVVQDDGKVRLVLKDWPILGEVSKIAA